MKNPIRISVDLSLPLSFVTGTQAILATKGMGKSHLAQVEAEELLDLNQVIVAIDPTDAWWGLRSSTDGMHDGYPVMVVGGDHGDIPLDPNGAAQLEPDSGAALAEAIVAERFSAVICTEGLSAGGEIRLVREFLETLYRKNREPIHVFVDEADMFAPQKPFDPEDARSIRAMSNIVRRGRKKGIGCTMITQRSSVLNKDVLAMVDMLMVLGMSHNLDIEPIERWMKRRKKDDAQALIEEMLSSLPELQTGDAWAWSPTTKLHQRFRARLKRTFDSGATPKVGEKPRVAKVLAPIDIKRLGEKIAAAVERQKESDPVLLRLELARLRKANEALVAGSERAIRAGLEAKPGKEIEKAVIKDAQLKRLERIMVAGGKIAMQAIEFAQRFGADAEALRVSVMAIDSPRNQSVRTGVTSDAKSAPCVPGGRPTLARQDSQQARTAAPPRQAKAADSALTPAHLRLLSAVAWWESLGFESPDLIGVAFIAGTSTSSSTFDNNRARLRVAGYLEYPTSGTVRLTPAGRDVAPPPIIEPTNDALHRAVIAKLTPALRRMFIELITRYPAETSLEDFATTVGSSTSSSTFDNNRSWLRARGLAEYPRSGFIRATKLLFPEGAR